MSDTTAIVFDPRGVVEAEARPLAARPHSLDGLRLAVLDNTKWNAGTLLRGAARALAGRHAFATVTHYRKESFARVAAPQVIDAIVADNDIVLTAIGD
jgi:hypothetical protein